MNKLLWALESITVDTYQEISDALIKFDAAQVDLELQRQASLYSYYHGLMSAAKKQLNDANADLDKYVSLTRAIAKQNSRKEKLKLTARDLDDVVTSSDEYYKLKQIATDKRLVYDLQSGS